MRKPLSIKRPSATVLVTAALAAVIAASGTAFAAKLITGAQIANNSITGADIKQNSLTGADVQPNSLTGADIKSGSVSMADLSGPAKTALDGKDGATGATGATGAKGDKGLKGDKGDKGDNGADFTPHPEYGVASVWVKRGDGAASRWAGYVTPALPAVTGLGADAGGSFRFTCTQVDTSATPDEARCRVSLKATVLSDTSTATARVASRILISRQDLSSGALTYCEYADFASDAGTLATVGRVATTVEPFAASDALTMGIGGTSDCDTGFADVANSQPDPDPLGTIATASHPSVTEIWVPAGYYNVTSSFQFYAS